MSRIKEKESGIEGSPRFSSPDQLWVPSLDQGGTCSLMPFSFYSLVSSKPPILAISTAMRAVDQSHKDTFSNVRVTGEFVVNFVTKDLLEAMNTTARDFPPEIDEFAQAGLTPHPTKLVKLLKVAESPIHLERRISHIIPFGEPVQGSYPVHGEALLIHGDDYILDAQDCIDLDVSQPIGRLGRSFV